MLILKSKPQKRLPETVLSFVEQEKGPGNLPCWYVKEDLPVWLLRSARWAGEEMSLGWIPPTSFESESQLKTLMKT